MTTQPLTDVLANGLAVRKPAETAGDVISEATQASPGTSVLQRRKLYDIARYRS